MSEEEVKWEQGKGFDIGHPRSHSTDVLAWHMVGKQAEVNYQGRLFGALE